MEGTTLDLVQTNQDPDVEGGSNGSGASSPNVGRLTATDGPLDRPSLVNLDGDFLADGPGCSDLHPSLELRSDFGPTRSSDSSLSCGSDGGGHLDDLRLGFQIVDGAIVNHLDGLVHNFFVTECNKNFMPRPASCGT